MAAPTISTCTTSEHPLGVTSTCPTGLCTFDAGTGLVSCDQSAQTSAVKAFLVSGGSGDFIYFGTDTGGDRCCKISDPSVEVEGFRLRGGSAADQLGFRYCDGSLGAQASPTAPTCSGTDHQLTTTNTRPLTAEILGGAGGDEILGTNNTNVSEILRGNGGVDTIMGGGGADVLYGGDNHDILYGGSGNDTLHGDDGGDECYGGDGDDTLYGGPGNDFKLTGDDGNDLIFGGPGNDTLSGYAGNDRLFGEDGTDTLEGDGGDDILCDGGDPDWFKGGDGDDFLWYDDSGGGSPDGSSGADVGGSVPGTNDTCSVSITDPACENVVSVLPIPVQCVP